MEKLSLKVVVAGRTYPLTLNEGEQEKVIKAAEDKAAFGQTQFLACKDSVGDLALRVIDLVAVGKINDFLCVVLLTLMRDQGLVSNDVVKVWCSQSSWIAKIIELDPSTPLCKYSHSVVLCNAL